MDSTKKIKQWQAVQKDSIVLSESRDVLIAPRKLAEKDASSPRARRVPAFPTLSSKVGNIRLRNECYANSSQESARREKISGGKKSFQSRNHDDRFSFCEKVRWKRLLLALCAALMEDYGEAFMRRKSTESLPVKDGRYRNVS